VSPPLRYGFRVVGATTGRRRLVDAAAAFAGYCSCATTAEVEKEAYLSAFAYGDDFRAHLEETGSTREFPGACWSPWVWFDIDRAHDAQLALLDTRRLASFALDRYRGLDELDLLLFFSGNKGYHVGLPTRWEAAPSPWFHATARRFAEKLAEAAGVVIDAGVYDKVRCFRAPNSRHSKTGLHKRRLTFDELMNLSAGRVRELAASPLPFAPARQAADLADAGHDWHGCVQQVAREAAAARERRALALNGSPRLNRQTLAYIRDGADEGDRHRLLFSAAANLAEFACPPALAHELLTPAARDSGLPPKEIHRQIECGLRNGSPPAGGDGDA
jgi:hypothetical protein